MATWSWSRLNTVLLLVILLAIVALLATRAYGGPLDPPAAPGATSGVRLPGTPIDALPFTISQPGNYYVTRNLTMSAGGDGITITANDVTLDLGGFTLDGADLGGTGVLTTSLSGTRGVVVRNGIVQNWTDGVNTGGTAVEHVSAHDNGNGIRVSSGRLTDCSAYYNTGIGVIANFSTVTDCASSANGTGLKLITASLRGCVAESNSTGIEADRSVIEGCSVLSSGVYGIVADEGTVVRNNTVLFSGSTGIRVAGASMVIDNSVRSSGSSVVASGIFVETNGNRITGNNVTGTHTIGGLGGVGIDVAGSNNTIDENSVLGNGGIGVNVLGSKNTVVRNSAVNNGSPVDNYAFGAGNNPGTEIAANSTSDWSNTQ